MSNPIQYTCMSPLLNVKYIETVKETYRGGHWQTAGWITQECKFNRVTDYSIGGKFSKIKVSCNSETHICHTVLVVYLSFPIKMFNYKISFHEWMSDVMRKPERNQNSGSGSNQMLKNIFRTLICVFQDA